MSAGTLAVGRYRVPRGESAAQRHFLAQLFLPRSRRERWQLRLAERLPPRLGVRLLAGAVGGGGGEEPAADGRCLEREVLATIRGVDDSGMRSVTLLGYRGQRRSVRWLFAPGEREPRWLAKLAPAGSGGLDVERRRLDELARLPEDLRASIARVVAHRTGRGWEVLVTTALPGPTLAAALARSDRDTRRRLDLFGAAAGWLARFHRATRSAGGGPAPASLVAALRRGESGPWLQRLAEGFASGALTTGGVHGDYWPRNLLVDPEPARITGVVDWEAAVTPDLPHRDLYDFVFAHALAVSGDEGRARPVEVFRAALLEPTRWRAATQAFLVGYTHQAGIDSRWLEPLLELYLSELAAGVRTLGITPPERRIEVARTWRSVHATAGRPAFSG